MPETQVIGYDNTTDDGEVCGGELTLGVYRSNAGHYIGVYCAKCGPYDRHSGYFKTREEALRLLPDYMENL